MGDSRIRSRSDTWSHEKASGKDTTRPREELLKRLPSKSSRVNAFDALHVELALASEEYLCLGDGGRIGVLLAVRALFAYLEGQGIPPSCLQTLIAVEAAIVDAEFGAGSPIFTPKRDGGRPNTQSTKQAFDGLLAAVMECCVMHFKAQGYRPYLGPAAQLAAKLLRESKLEISMSAKRLKKLRERVRGSCAQSPARVYFDAIIGKSNARENPLETANFLLNLSYLRPPREDS